jgi:isopenicillin N synthase-like dioxygenase
MTLVPTIDISDWATDDPDRRRAVAAKIDQAAATVGFMQIVGHGIADDVIARLTSVIDGFFARPLEEKNTLRPPSSAINRGYTAPKSERLSYSLGVSSADDLFEAFNVGAQASDFPGLELSTDTYSENIWPSEPAPFAGHVRAWFEQARLLAETLTAIFASALGLPDGFFDPYTDHSIDVLRVNHYQLPDADVRLAPGQLGMGPHTDYGIVTVLWADPLPGLQILDPNGRWHDVMPGEGALLVNLGDLLARWTNDRWRSTMHRVLAPIDAEGRPFRRRSAAFFHDGNADAVISTLPGCADVGADPYEPVTVADHLAAKLAGSRGLTPNTAARREAARLSATG